MSVCESEWFLQGKKEKGGIWALTERLPFLLRDWAPQHFGVLGESERSFPSYYTCFQSGASEKVARVSYKLPDKNCKDFCIASKHGFLHLLLWPSQDFHTNKNILGGGPRKKFEALCRLFFPLRWIFAQMRSVPPGCSNAWGPLCYSLLNKNGDSPAKKQYSLSNKEGQESVVSLLKYRQW